MILGVMQSPPSLEDDFRDAIRKAASGLGVSDEELETCSELNGLNFARLFSAPIIGADQLLLESALLRIARRLELGGPQLVALARGEHRPPSGLELEGLFVASTPFGGMLVNAALVWDPATGQAAAFDSGGDAGPLLQEVTGRKLKLGAIFITHTHSDHVFEVDRLVERTGAQVYTPQSEPWGVAEPVAPGQRFRLGGLGIEARPTPGHSIGGATYVVVGLSRPVAFVGDAIFAGSIGGAKVSYAAALKGIREQILSLPPETILVPGHGPLTTVGYERVHNTFCVRLVQMPD